ncbi:Coiled-coil-helix-coiled-coil-helix domain-containing protein 10, mitochondrial [Pseudolycoriella hygida]|uniref:Coiled-coil-helix-coiled-coil-helix domain-containing protein 10, mitochondrial n=1 Tax=Pseudolycoriella hygida TaxID=35572 RepID=A0A9Q0S0S9_9DIPT|nr:Coiled-coil-helix-coiled-coil-helix domain-containing protein 10, mitochondrial [Pseudolycoriella hygida]
MSSSEKRPRGRKPPGSSHNTNQKSNVPSPHPPQPPNVPKEPGIFQRVAETAAGVAVGSAIGNAITNVFSGLFGSGPKSPTPSSETTSAADKPSSQINECERQRLNFVHCTEKETDLTKCEELQKEYKECRLKYNLP